MIHGKKIGLIIGSKKYGSRKNDMLPGYDYATSTTECQKCGHTPTQLFGFGACMCDCHGRENGEQCENTKCPICVKEEGAGLEEHLVAGHGMDLQDASVVARDTETRSL